MMLDRETWGWIKSLPKEENEEGFSGHRRRNSRPSSDSTVKAVL